MDIKMIQRLDIPNLREVSLETSNIGPVVKLSFYKKDSLQKAIDFFFQLGGEENNPILDYNHKVLWLDLDRLRA